MANLELSVVVNPAVDGGAGGGGKTDLSRRESEQNDGVEPSTATDGEEKQRRCPPWLLAHPTCFAAGLVIWLTTLYFVLAVAADAFDEDSAGGGTDGGTNATCDASLEGLSANFFDKSCIADLDCDDKIQIVEFMTTFVDPLRVESILLTMCSGLFNLMLLQKGGCSDH